MFTITTEARLYALRELARRAGVELSLFEQWQIEPTPAYTKLWLDEKRCIQFPNADNEFWRGISSGNFPVAKFNWSFPVNARLATLVPEFVVPFASCSNAGPLFRVLDDSLAECSVDLLSSIWLTLSRFEETIPGSRDHHGRFTAKQSIALSNKFLDRPIVDEYGLAFEQILKVLLPRWTPLDRELLVKLSHDIDFVGIPFRPGTTAGHILNRRSGRAALRDLLSTFTGVKPAELQSVVEAVEIARQYDLRSAAYWKSSPAGPFDTWYNLTDPKVRGVIDYLKDLDVELGVHPGYQTFLAPERLRAEVEILRDVLHEEEVGGRQHFLRWSPATWQHWESCGLVYDSSVGFADHVGFRAGTCFPYRPWLLNLNREADLLEIPLLVMDTTLVSYMQLTMDEALHAASKCIERCALVGGVFTLLFHNDSLLRDKLTGLYRQLLTMLAGTRTYDWKSELQQLRASTVGGHDRIRLTSSPVVFQ